MNLLSELTIFTQESIDKTFELSDSVEEKIYFHEESKLQWGCLRNFYKDPIAVKEFLQKFPIVEQSSTNSPGFQQHFSFPTMMSLKNVYKYLYNIITKYNFPHPKIENWSTDCWQTMCNTHWVDMKVNAANMIPHFDQPNMAFNIWLTKDNPAGTDFYYYKKNNKTPAYFLEQFARDEPDFVGEFIRYVVNNECDEFIEWNPYEIDTFFTDRGWHKYLTMDPEYNSVTFYPGIYFHKPAWDIRNYRKDLLRYSQVISYTYTSSQQYQLDWYEYSRQ